MLESREEFVNVASWVPTSEHMEEVVLKQEPVDEFDDTTPQGLVPTSRQIEENVVKQEFFK